MDLLAQSLPPDAGLLLVAGAVFLVAGLVKGIVGLGLPTVAMALLALVMTPAQAAALLIIPSFVTNVWQCRPLKELTGLMRRLGPMQVGVVVGTLGGSWLLGAPAGPWAGLSLGLALLAYSAWGLLGLKLTIAPAREAWAGPLTGLVTGFITSATGVFVVPAVAYLQALLPRDRLIQAMGISFTVSTIALAIGLSIDGSFRGGEAGTSALMLAPAIIGMMIGQAIRERLSPALFRTCLMSALGILGLQMVVRYLLGN